ncbi:ELOVL fatty acid elongase 8b isoform 1-T1 [Spinachia spinachia]
MDSAWTRVLSVHQRIVDNGDKRTDQWLLVYSPVPVALIFLAYLFVVWAGPRVMRHREPFDLKGVLVLYNFAMVGLSAYMFYEVLDLFWLNDRTHREPGEVPGHVVALQLQPPVPAGGLQQQAAAFEDGQRLLVVLLLQGHRARRHDLLHHEEEEQPADFPSRLPPRHHDLQLVGGHQVRGRRTVVLHRPGQHAGSHRDVLVLRPGGARPPHAEVPVVEEIPHLPAVAAVPAVPPAHRLQPVHRVRLPRRHERGGVRLLRHAHRPLQ